MKTHFDILEAAPQMPERESPQQFHQQTVVTRSRAKHLIDWAFACCCVVAIGFLASVFLTVMTGEMKWNLDLGLYTYAGPFYGCIPVMALGMTALPGCACYLVIAFSEGRRERRWLEQKEAIEKARLSGEHD